MRSEFESSVDDAAAWRAVTRSPWQRFYGWAHRRRRLFWSSRAESLGRPTVSIGNLHWGGSGKTPTAMAVARGLTGHGLRVAVLSRGYRRKGRGPLVVSLGEGLLASVERAGDEPAMLAEQTPGVVVAVGADRRAAAALVLQRAPNIDVFVLDDGFSHVRVRRDVEILTFPAVDPFAGGLLLPGGRLREPLRLVRLADAAILTGVEAGAESALAGRPRGSSRKRGGEAPRTVRSAATTPADFEATLRRHGFVGRVFTSTLRAELRPLPSPGSTTRPVGGPSAPGLAAHGQGPPGKGQGAGGEGQGAGGEGQGAGGKGQGPRGKGQGPRGEGRGWRGEPPHRPLLVTAVARPERVARTAAAAGLKCVHHLRFPDHHRYPPRTLRKIEAACARHRCDAVITTSKDAVKLRGRLPDHLPPLLELRVEAEIEAEFLPWLTHRLDPHLVATIVGVS